LFAARVRQGQRRLVVAQRLARVERGLAVAGQIALPARRLAAAGRERSGRALADSEEEGLEGRIRGARRRGNGRTGQGGENSVFERRHGGTLLGWMRGSDIDARNPGNFAHRPDERA
jgi:hypothetical protein